MAEKKQITFKYLFDDNYNPKYANGIYGGLVGLDIVLNFYIERHALPISETHSVTDKLEVGPQISHEPQDLSNSMVRFVENGVIMNLATAKVLHKWLGDQITKAQEPSTQKK